MNCDCEYAAGACRLCGEILLHEEHRRMCRKKCDVEKSLADLAGSEPGSIHLPRVAVGGVVEALLTAIGITKERVQQWTQLKDCGCAARQRWLDRWGYAKQEQVERIINKAAGFYFGGNAIAGDDREPETLDAPATVDGKRNSPDATQAATAEGRDEA